MIYGGLIGGGDWCVYQRTAEREMEVGRLRERWRLGRDAKLGENCLEERNMTVRREVRESVLFFLSDFGTN